MSLQKALTNPNALWMLFGLGFVITACIQPAMGAPTKNNGQQCNGDAECYSDSCYPGPGNGNASFCMSKAKNCAWPGTDGYMGGARSCWQGEPVGCMIPAPGSKWRFAPTGVGNCSGTTQPAQ